MYIQSIENHMTADYSSIPRPPPDEQPQQQREGESAAAAACCPGGESAPIKPRTQQPRQQPTTTASNYSLGGLFRKAFSMDVGDDDWSVESPHLLPHQYGKYYVSTYMLYTALFVSFALGFSCAFYVSSKYWTSEAGMAHLGCVGVSVGVVGASGRSRSEVGSGSILGRLVGPRVKRVGEKQGGGALDRRSGLLLLRPSAPGVSDASGATAALHPLWLDRLPNEFDLDYDRPSATPLDAADAATESFPHEELLGKSLLDLVTGKDSSSSNTQKTSSSSSDSSISPVQPNVYLNHLEAYELLLDDDRNTGGVTSLSPYSSHYFLLTTGLDVQVNQAYCSAATVAAILNSLRFLHPRADVGVDIPVDSTFAPYSYATQMDVFGRCTEEHVVSNAGSDVGTEAGTGWGTDGILTYPYGLNLEQVADMLRCHLNSTAGWTVTATHVDNTHLTLSKMRYDMKAAVADPSARLVVNYHRAAAGQVGGGHFSPVGSYNPSTDAFLVLDVARYKYPPVWISSDRLYRAMGTYDECGSWDYPSAQGRLNDRLRVAKNESDVMEAREVLGCEKSLRGYIVAKRAS